jgi:hypothetical protein
VRVSWIFALSTTPVAAGEHLVFLTIAVGEEDLVVALEALHHVIRTEDGDLCGSPEAARAHHLDIGPGDGQDGAGAVLRRADGAERVLRGVVRRRHRVPGQERCQVRFAARHGSQS